MDKAYTTIIIDDEAPARIGLENLLKKFPDSFDIIATAKNATEASQKIEELEPELIFLDIEMPGKSGFDLLAELKTIPLVVFCTAYDQYALQAFETHSIDYLVKPVKLERIEKTIQKLKSFQRTSSSDQILKVLKEISSQKKKKEMTSITVKKNDSLIFIKLEEVAFFEADTNYVNIHRSGMSFGSVSETYLSSESVSSLEEKLPDHFLRIQRGIIINTNYIKEIQKYFNSRFVITLTDGKSTKVTSGRSYNLAIKEFMGVL